MREFIWSTVVLALVPMTLLNPLGRPAFLGYYLGVLTVWLVIAIGSASRATRAPGGMSQSA